MGSVSTKRNPLEVQEGQEEAGGGNIRGRKGNSQNISYSSELENENYEILVVSTFLRGIKM